MIEQYKEQVRNLLLNHNIDFRETDNFLLVRVIRTQGENYPANLAKISKAEVGRFVVSENPYWGIHSNDMGKFKDLTAQLAHTPLEER